MSQITRLAQLLGAQVANQDLTTIELVVNTLRLGGLAGTLLDKTTIDLLIANTHAPQSDNQTITAGNGLSGGGSGPTVSLAVAAADASINSSGSGIAVVKSATGGVVLAGDGLAINPDGSTLELNTNALRVKDSGISTVKIADNAVDTNKLRSDALVDANRPVTSNHLRDGSVTNAKIVAGISTNKVGAGTVDDTTFGYLAGVTSSIQPQLDSKALQATAINTATPLTGGGDLSTSRTISIPKATNLVDGYLAAADWITFNAKVSTSRQINTTAPLTGGGDLSADRTFAIPKATGGVDGYLAATDFTTFNAKQPAGNYLTALSGDVSAAGPGSASATVNSVGGSSAANIHAAELAANAATAANTPTTIVERDGSGNFSATTITAALTGTASGNPPNARNINTTAPLTGGGNLSADRTIAIPKATTGVDGYLAATDFTTFNNKQNTLVYVDASTVLASGLAAATPITLPGSAVFSSSHAADIGIIVNKLWLEEGRDFTVVGAGPTYTQIQFSYNLPNDTVLRVKQVK